MNTTNRKNQQHIAAGAVRGRFLPQSFPSHTVRSPARAKARRGPAFASRAADDQVTAR
jgi:hypothetical protein